MRCIGIILKTQSISESSGLRPPKLVRSLPTCVLRSAESLHERFKWSGHVGVTNSRNDAVDANFRSILCGEGFGCDDSPAFGHVVPADCGINVSQQYLEIFADHVKPGRGRVAPVEAMLMTRPSPVFRKLKSVIRYCKKGTDHGCIILWENDLNRVEKALVVDCHHQAVSD